MITIHHVKKWRDCNVCMKQASMEVYFRSNFNSQGSIIALCDTCAKDMCVRVSEVIDSNDERKIESVEE